MNKVAILEPVAHRSKDQPYLFSLSAPRSDSGQWDHLITTDQAEAYAAAKVREALEQAAAVADRQHFGGDCDDDLSWTSCAARIAASIRALIPQHDNE